MASSTSGTFTVAWLAIPVASANSAQATRPAMTPSGIPTTQRGGGQRAGLPGDRAQHLPPGEPEGLEHRQVAAAPPHPGEQHVREGADGEHAEHRGERERGVPDGGVVLDVAGPLVGGHRARAVRAADRLGGGGEQRCRRRRPCRCPAGSGTAAGCSRCRALSCSRGVRWERDSSAATPRRRCRGRCRCSAWTGRSRAARPCQSTRSTCCVAGPGLSRRPVDRARTVWPIRAPSARMVCAPSAISSGVRRRPPGQHRQVAVAVDRVRRRPRPPASRRC